MNSSLNRDRTKVLVMGAMFTALSVILTRLFSFILPIGGLPTIRIGFGSIPITLSGILFGPVIGGLVGLGADVIGVMVNPQGAFHPGFTLSSVLQGVIPALVFMGLRFMDDENDLLKKIAVQEVVATVIISILLNTYWLSTMFGKGFMVLLPGRLISSAINIVLNILIVNKLYKVLSKLVRNV